MLFVQQKIFDAYRPITLNNQSNDVPGSFGLATFPAMILTMILSGGRSSMHRLWWAP